jgi:MoaD family protein
VAIDVRVPTVLRKHTGGEKTLTASGSTLRDLVEEITATNPGLRDALLDDQGKLRRFVNVYVNDEDVRFLSGLETPIQDGDTVSILPAVAGG